MKRTLLPILVVPVAFLAIGCASSQTAAPGTEVNVYRRLFLTMPSHSAGFEIETTSNDFIGPGSSSVSSEEAVHRAYDALRFELIDAGFDVVTRDHDADAVLELTMGGIGDRGDAERAFVVFRDRASGRILVVFRANAREEARSVEEIMARIAGAIEEKVGASPTGS
jgi:hypothetical protein